MRNLLRFAAVMILPVTVFVMMSCEGPRGPAGKDGQDGQDGVDANETCKTCHSATDVDRISVEFQFSKHHYGEVAFEEAGSTGCTPCHTQQAFLYVVENNIPSTFQTTNSGVSWFNSYASIPSQTLGEIGCATCHNQLHTTYGRGDTVLTTTAAVSMTMWGGAKSINLTQDGGRSNLCAKCHQPRPLTASLSGGYVVKYDSLRDSPNLPFYDSTRAATTNYLRPSYRTHVHYGTVSAVFAGEGGIEFPGTLAYDNSAHTTLASCQDCHMAEVYGVAGGHTFNVKGNFNGCNASGCHTGVSSSNSTFWTGPRNEIKGLLNALADSLNNLGHGMKILHSNADAESNLWAGLTTGNYDGYLDIYDPSTNPSGAWQNPTVSGSWTTAQKSENYAKPQFPSLKNGHMGAMINFQFALREYSLGIHNTKYVKALLTNSIAVVDAANN